MFVSNIGMCYICTVSYRIVLRAYRDTYHSLCIGDIPVCRCIVSALLITGHIIGFIWYFMQNTRSVIYILTKEKAPYCLSPWHSCKQNRKRSQIGQRATYKFFNFLIILQIINSVGRLLGNRHQAINNHQTVKLSWIILFNWYVLYSQCWEMIGNANFVFPRINSTKHFNTLIHI